MNIAKSAEYINDESLYQIIDSKSCEVIDQWHNQNGLVQTVRFDDGTIADVYPPFVDSHDAVVIFDNGDVGVVSVPISI